MLRTMMKSKIHRANVTEANLNYEGSLTIDQDLLDEADIYPHEQIHVWDVTSGARIITYALSGERGSGVICVNGAGAHLIKEGNIIIIATFTTLKSKPAKKYKPKVVFVDNANKSTDGPVEPSEALATPSSEATPPSPTEESAKPPAARAGKRKRDTKKI
jgi:aspartate 1-decarboxylase